MERFDGSDRARPFRKLDAWPSGQGCRCDQTTGGSAVVRVAAAVLSLLRPLTAPRLGVGFELPSGTIFGWETIGETLLKDCFMRSDFHAKDQQRQSERLPRVHRRGFEQITRLECCGNRVGADERYQRCISEASVRRRLELRTRTQSYQSFNRSHDI